MRSNRPRLSLVLAVFLIAGAMLGPVAAGPAASAPVGNNVLARARDIALGDAARGPHERLPSSGVTLTAVAAAEDIGRRVPAGARGGAAPRTTTQGCANTFGGGERGVDNVRVNQDCSLRGQAEETIAVNPTNARNLIVGQNDARLGFNHCGFDWSMDGGRTWGDQSPPFYQFLLGDGHTADACSDPSLAFDSRGNAYIAGVLYDALSAANAVVVAKSNAPIGGAYYHSPAPLPFQTMRDVPLGVVASDNDPNVFNDKPFIAADAGSRSPKADNVYTVWVRFAFTASGLHAPIYFSQSSDGGATWSPGVEISGANGALCTAGSAEAAPSACDQDNGPVPVVGPDGTVYVAYFNGNTPGIGLGQHLLVSCRATVDCSTPASWTPPAKIADDVATQPVGPDPRTGCFPGFQCLPPNGYRLDDGSAGSLSIDGDGVLYAVWADFRNGGGSCGPLGPAATATPPCDNDVFYAYSTDRGVTWSPAVDVTPAARFGPSAQWQPWSAVASDGKALWIGYYDRHYGDCEATGCNDITLARVGAPATDRARVSYTRITTASMPNLVPSNNPISAGFLGDYMGLAVDPSGHPVLVWADTRGLDGAVDDDIYFTRGP